MLYDFDSIHQLCLFGYIYLACCHPYGGNIKICRYKKICDLPQQDIHYRYAPSPRGPEPLLPASASNRAELWELIQISLILCLNQPHQSTANAYTSWLQSQWDSMPGENNHKGTTAQESVPLSVLYGLGVIVPGVFGLHGFNILIQK